MKDLNLPYAPFRFIPKDGDFENFERLCSFIEPRNPNDLAMRYAYFGKDFGFDLGLVARNTCTIKGNPTINADGLMALVRMNPNCLYLRETERSEEASTWELKRSDEPDDIVHTLRITFDDAVKAGWTRSPMWEKIRTTMLSKRAGAWLCRKAMPEVCSGMYTPDEMAESKGLSGRELEKAMVVALGEDVNMTRPPQPQSAPPESRPPQPQRNEVEITNQNSIPAKPKSEPIKQLHTHRATPSSMDAFKNIDNLIHNCEFNFIPLDEANQAALNQGARLDTMSEADRSKFFYSWMLQSTLRKSGLKDAWWRNTSEAKPVFNALRQEFPALGDIADNLVGKSLGRADFWEAAKVSAHFTDDKLKEAKRVLKKLINTPDINAASYLCSM